MNSVYEWFLERSAIMSADGNMPIYQADFCAYALTASYCKRTGQTMPSDGYLGALRPGASDPIWSDELGDAGWYEDRNFRIKGKIR
ncbi:hypothetical protein [Paraburkholderia acidisoli]|uniref:Uncharacterized protein n=1 Tax=Paraburkholderia acidisoli TaxID=2571748 RepID=A0A7Z2GQV0_9BURK|nr:hypothetical protein [Paraburkholderia acidisoli]QGZ66243.1 hypothetical protein FAZ98_31055 [Paraburkholderia acidisoli]QGZ66333.1 hypothetical protein FAZ98_31560 [Paraburkholderia acidisoli]